MGSHREVRLSARAQVTEGESKLFTPKDFPELWAQVREHGVQALDSEDPTVREMLAPAEIRAGADIENFQLYTQTKLLMFARGDNWAVELEAYHDKVVGTDKYMLEVSDYGARFPMKGGTQAFYENLQYQMGNMNTPVIWGQKVPASVGYYIHRVGQVPAGLLEGQYTSIRDEVAKHKGRAPEVLVSDYPNISFLVGVHEVNNRHMLSDAHRTVLEELDEVFDQMTPYERQTDAYKKELCGRLGIPV